MTSVPSLPFSAMPLARIDSKNRGRYAISPPSFDTFEHLSPSGSKKPHRVSGVLRVPKCDLASTLAPTVFQSIEPVIPGDPRLACTPRVSAGQFKEWLLWLVSTVKYWLNCTQYSDFQVAGLTRLTNARAEFTQAGPTVWLCTHTDNPGDAEVIAGLVSRLPPVAGASGRQPIPHVVMKKSDGWLEWFATDFLFGDFAIHQDINRRSTPEGELARRAANRRTMEDRAAQVLAEGGHMLIFPEGRVDGNGTVQLPKGLGAVNAFMQSYDSGAPVMFIPVGLTYEPIGRKRPKVCINMGHPFICSPDATPEALRHDLQAALCVQHTVTLSGIVGAHLLEERAQSNGNPVVLTQPAMLDLVTRCVAHVQTIQADEAPSALHELVIDADLLTPMGRQTAVAAAFADLQRRGYLDAAGTLNSDRLGPMADPTPPPLADPTIVPPHLLHRSDPLCYWGNRMRQVLALPAVVTRLAA